MQAELSAKDALKQSINKKDVLKLERLRKELEKGINELDRGEGVPYDRNAIIKEIERALV